MQKHEITKYFSNEGTRNEVRMRILKEILKEEPGTGMGNNASVYIYYVEEMKNGDRIYLQTPTNLYNEHSGGDFLVCVENVNYAPEGKRRRNYPKHDDFYNDLIEKKKENPKMYAKFYELLRKVYECHDVTDEEINKIHFESGYSPEHIIKVLKWMFIEQDICYWNYAGRKKTWEEAIPEK